MKMKKMFFGFLCLLFTIIGLNACSFGTLKTNALELSSSYARKATDTIELNDEILTNISDFSMNLFKEIMTIDEENDLVSPLSAIICLAMIANGADGETKLQMEKALGMNVDTLNKALYSFTSSLYTSKDCKINIADSIWFRDEDNRLHVNESFLQANADWYDAQIYAAPFDISTLNDINNWCNHYTNGMIDKMIDEISKDTVMYLINALTFDAQWATTYNDNNVINGEFYNYDDNKKSVKMLSSEEHIYLTSDKAKGFAKNYSNDKYSFVALLPNEGIDIYDFINSLNGKEWMNLWKTRNNKTVMVQMPEFKFSSSMKLNDVLKSMGMVDMFNENANFSKLGYSERGNLYISEVCQKTFIQVDRNGTKAAAITWGDVKSESIETYISVYLNRPYVFSIVDNKTGLPIFVGAVTYL